MIELDKHEQDRAWLLSNALNRYHEVDIEKFCEKVARFEQENGMTEESARSEAFSMLGAVYQ